MISFLVIAALSVFLHELGHVLVGLACGWKWRGVVVRWRYGAVGVAMEQKNPSDIWKVALGGLGATAALALGSFLALPGSYAVLAFVLNTVLLLGNLVPLSVTDGGQVVRGLRQG